MDPTKPVPLIVSAALEAVRHLTAVCVRSRTLTQEISQAEQAISAALYTADTRSQFLQEIATAHERGEIPFLAYQKILATIGRLLKASVDLTSECERITRHGKI